VSTRRPRRRWETVASTIGADAKKLHFVDDISTRATALKHLHSLARAPRGCSRSRSRARWRRSHGSTNHRRDHHDRNDREEGGGNCRRSQSTNTITAADLAKARTEAQAEATEDERERCKGILKASAAAQRDLAVKLVTEGTPLVEALSALNVDLTDRLAQARALPTESTQSLAKGNTARRSRRQRPPRTRASRRLPEGDAKWKAEYEGERRAAGRVRELRYLPRLEAQRAHARGAQRGVTSGAVSTREPTHTVQTTPF
jgi:hypothetical protein